MLKRSAIAALLLASTVIGGHATTGGTMTTHRPKPDPALTGLAPKPTAEGQADEGAGILKSIDARKDQYSAVAKQIWDYAELGFQESRSSALLQKTLADAGFTVDKGIAGMPTAFVASYGSGKPVIAIVGEFDALPALSQAAGDAVRHAVTAGAPGHACGHLVNSNSLFSGIYNQSISSDGMYIPIFSSRYSLHVATFI
jgi:hypothetical protein